MDRIRPWLYIGRYLDTCNRVLLSTYKIEAMLQLAALVEHPGITSLFLEIEDGKPLPHDLLRQGLDFVIAEKEQGHNILIACGAGISRSSAFTIAALKEIEGVSLEEAFREVKHRHRSALPHPVVWESVCDYYGESDPFKIYRYRHRP